MLSKHDRHDTQGVHVWWAQIDLNMYPERRREMLAHGDGVIALPQLRVNGVYVGDGNTIQEMEDFGELDEVLQAIPPPPPPSPHRCHWRHRSRPCLHYRSIKAYATGPPVTVERARPSNANRWHL